MENFVNVLPQILIGLAAIIPMLVVLVKYIKKATEDKNWNILVKMILDLMVQAEVDYSNGADRKSFVLDELKTLSKTINFEVDWDKVSDLIDALCHMANNVNVEIQEK